MVRFGLTRVLPKSNSISARETASTVERLAESAVVDDHHSVRKAEQPTKECNSNGNHEVRDNMLIL